MPPEIGAVAEVVDGAIVVAGLPVAPPLPTAADVVAAESKLTPSDEPPHAVRATTAIATLVQPARHLPALRPVTGARLCRGPRARSAVIASCPVGQLAVTTLREMVSAGEVRHRALSSAVLLRNNVRRAGWAALGHLPVPAARHIDSIDLLEDDEEPEPFHGQPGAWDTYALRISGDLTIEPHYGWIIAGRTRLLERPLPYAMWSKNAPNLLSKPSLAASFGFPVQSADTVISLRIPWEDNYYHYFNDVLGRLRLIESLDIDPDVPVVLSSWLAGRSYVRESIERGVFGDRPLLIQPPRTHLHCRVVYSVDKRAGDRRDYDFFLDRLVPDGPGPGDRRVLLVRSAWRGRALTNDAEVRALGASRGFEVVDTEGWTLADQIELLRNTRVLIGVHGAGLTNIIFRRGAPLTLLELIPPGPFPLSFNAVHDDESDYESLCRYFGFTYFQMTGTMQERLYKRSQNFQVDIDVLAERLELLDA
jgi:hypothetical protein